MNQTQDERFSPAIWDNLLRSGHLRRCSEYHRYASALRKHQSIKILPRLIQQIRSS